MSRQINKIIMVRLNNNIIQAVSAHDIYVVAFGLDELTKTIKPKNIPGKLKIIPRNITDAKTIIEKIRIMYALSKCIKHENPEIVHVNALQDLFFVFFAVRIFFPRRCRPAIIAMSRNPLTWKNSRKAWLAEKWIRYLADGFISLSTIHKNQLLGLGAPANKITVIPNPYDLDQLDLIKSTDNNFSIESKKSVRIIYIADICERKAQDVLIQAASLILMKYPELKFDLIGKIIPGEEAYTDKIITLINELHISEKVHYIGSIPYNQVIHELNNSDIVAFPSTSEMMPRAVIEAMLAGKPVVASAVDGICDLIQDHTTGILVQSRNVEELAVAFLELIENPSIANELGLAGQKYVLDYCSPERVGRLFREFYQSILDRTH